MSARLVTMHARLVCHGSRDIHAELVGVERLAARMSGTGRVAFGSLARVFLTALPS